LSSCFNSKFLGGCSELPVHVGDIDGSSIDKNVATIVATLTRVLDNSFIHSGLRSELLVCFPFAVPIKDKNRSYNCLRVLPSFLAELFQPIQPSRRAARRVSTDKIAAAEVPVECVELEIESPRGLSLFPKTKNTVKYTSS